MKPFENWNPKSLVLVGVLLGACILLLLAAVPSQTDFDGTYFKTNSLPISLTGFLTNWAKLDTNVSGGDTIWTTNAPITDMEGGTVYGISSQSNLFVNTTVQIATSFLTNFWGTPSSSFLFGSSLSAMTVAASNASIVVFTDEISSAPSQLENNGDVFIFGGDALSGATLTGSSDFYASGTGVGKNSTIRTVSSVASVGDRFLSGSTLISGGQIGSLGYSMLSNSHLTNVSYLYAIGEGSLTSSTVNGLIDVYLMGPSLGASDLTGCSDIISFGRGNAVGVTWSGISHVAMFGSSTTATNIGDFVFGDKLYNYFFPGNRISLSGGGSSQVASLESDGSLTTGGNTNRWILGGVTNGAPDVNVDGTHYPLAVTDSPAITGTPTINGSNIVIYPSQISLSHAGNVSLDFTSFWTESDFTGCTGAVTFVTANLASGHKYTLFGRNTNSVNVVPTFPSWRWATGGGPPPVITAYKAFVLSLSSRSASDTNVFAAYGEEQ